MKSSDLSAERQNHQDDPRGGRNQKKNHQHVAKSREADGKEQEVRRQTWYLTFSPPSFLGTVTEAKSKDQIPDDQEQILGKREPLEKKEKETIEAASDLVHTEKKSWDDLNLVKPILKAVRELGFKHPTNIQ